MAAWPHGRTQNAPAVNQPFSSNNPPLLKNNRALLKIKRPLLENRWPLKKDPLLQVKSVLGIFQDALPFYMKLVTIPEHKKMFILIIYCIVCFFSTMQRYGDFSA